MAWGAATYLRWHLLAIIALILVAVALDSSKSVTAASLTTLLNSMAFVGFIALGETTLLIAGEFDLSVGAVSGISAVVGALLMVRLGLPGPVGIIGAIGVGGLFGLANGLITARLHVPAFLTTIGMTGVASGLGNFITRGEPVRGLPQDILDLGAARIGGLSWMFIVFAVLALVLELVLHFTVSGRRVYATGGDEGVARLVGVRTTRVKVACFVLTGMLAGTAGILQASYQSTALSTTGSSGVELQAVAAAVVGGTSIMGGVGSIAGALIGLLLVSVVNFALVSVGVPTNWQGMAVGLILIGAISLDVLQRRLRKVRSSAGDDDAADPVPPSGPGVPLPRPTRG
jgi:ribose transport system permease protein